MSHDKCCAKSMQLQLMKQTYSNGIKQKPHIRFLTARLRNINLETVHEKVYGQITLSFQKQSLF